MFPSLWRAAARSFTPSTPSRCVNIEARKCPEWWLLPFCSVKFFCLSGKCFSNLKLMIRNKLLSLSDMPGTHLNFGFCLTWKKRGRSELLIRFASECQRRCHEHEYFPKLFPADSVSPTPAVWEGAWFWQLSGGEQFLAILTWSYLSLGVTWFFFNMERVLFFNGGKICYLPNLVFWWERRRKPGHGRYSWLVLDCVLIPSTISNH